MKLQVGSLFKAIMSDSPPPGVDDDDQRDVAAASLKPEVAASASVDRPSGAEASTADPAANYLQYGPPPGYADYYRYYGYPQYGASGYSAPPGELQEHHPGPVCHSGLLGPGICVTHLQNACAGLDSSDAEPARVPFTPLS